MGDSKHTRSMVAGKKTYAKPFFSCLLDYFVLLPELSEGKGKVSISTYPISLNRFSSLSTHSVRDARVFFISATIN